MNFKNACAIRDGDSDPDNLLTDEERLRLEKKLKLVLEWVGVWIPDEIVLDGKIVPLHQVVWELVKKQHLSRDDESLLLSLEEKLSKRFRFDVEKIHKLDMTETQALSDFCEAAGLLRAIITLKAIELHEEKTVGEDEMRLRLRDAKKERAKRWLDFLHQLGY